MSGAAEVEDRVNMIPLIDTMFFLILFFMFVTKFTPEEKAIASLLPTDKGQGPGASSALPRQQVNIGIYPAGLQKGQQPSQYRDQVTAMIDAGTFNSKVTVGIGGDAVIEIQGAPLSEPTQGSAGMRTQIETFHGYVDAALKARELPGSRKDQAPVVISCYSGLSWKYALLAYDAVRAYESRLAEGHARTNDELMNAREVTFAPPRIRNYNSNELGNELYEIVSLR